LVPTTSSVTERHPPEIAGSTSTRSLSCTAVSPAAARGARVIGVDAAPRLLEVARERALSRGLDAEFREGDLLALPAGDGTADVVISVFGLIFASDPSLALREVARVLRPAGRGRISAPGSQRLPRP
jgi:ubiquinone/menaquinone biosynthesis C-methylase UbiE